MRRYGFIAYRNKWGASSPPIFLLPPFNLIIVMAKKTVQVEPSNVGPDTSRSRGRTLDDVTDEIIGAPGTPPREEYEDLMERKIVSAKLREFRMQHNLSQTELGEIIGVKRNQIYKLERDASNVTLSTLFKVFRALGIGIRLNYKESSPLNAVKATVVALLLLGACPKSPTSLQAVGLFCGLRVHSPVAKNCSSRLNIMENYPTQYRGFRSR
jgi:HTH-type transcriptional regulator/antitoxin HipB